MRINKFFALLTALVAVGARAQEVPPVPDEMKQVAWMVGTWEGEMTMTMGPEPMKTHSKMVIESVLGGRFIRESVSYDMGGMPVSGELMLCYDADKKQWQSFWFDSLAPGMMQMNGEPATDGTWVSEGSSEMPGMGKFTMRSTVKKVSDKEFTMKLEMKTGDEWMTFMTTTQHKKS